MILDDSNYYHEIDISSKISKDIDRYFSSSVYKNMEQIMNQVYINSGQIISKQIFPTPDWNKNKAPKKHHIYPPAGSGDGCLMSLDNMAKSNEGKWFGDLKPALEMYPQAMIFCVDFYESSFSPHHICVDLIQESGNSTQVHHTAIWHKTLGRKAARELWKNLKSVNWQI